MEKSRFNFSVASLGKVNIGTRSTNESEPQIIVKQTPAQFSLNGKAVALLGVKPGDYVTLFPNNEAENLGEQFLIAVAPKGYLNAAKLASSAKSGAGKILTFSWSAVWSILQQQDLDAVELGNEALFRLGVISESKKGYTANQRISYDLVDSGYEDVEIDGTTFEKLFVLTAPKKLDIIVRGSASDEEAEDDDAFATEEED